MTKKQAIQWLYKNSGWKKGEWVAKLGVSYAQLRKWVGKDKVNISSITLVKAAGLFHFGVEWLDDVQKELNLYPIREELSFSEKTPFTKEMISKVLKNFEKPVRTEVIQSDSEVAINHQVADFPMVHALQIKDSEDWSEEVGVDLPRQEIIDGNAIAAKVTDTTMVPVLKPGMVVYGVPQEEFTNGDMVLVKIPENGVLFGEYYRNGDVTLLIRLSAPTIPINCAPACIFKISWIKIV